MLHLDACRKRGRACCTGELPCCCTTRRRLPLAACSSTLSQKLSQCSSVLLLSLPIQRMNTARLAGTNIQDVHVNAPSGELSCALSCTYEARGRHWGAREISLDQPRLGKRCRKTLQPNVSFIRLDTVCSVTKLTVSTPEMQLAGELPWQLQVTTTHGSRSAAHTLSHVTLREDLLTRESLFVWPVQRELKMPVEALRFVWFLCTGCPRPFLRQPYGQSGDMKPCQLYRSLHLKMSLHLCMSASLTRGICRSLHAASTAPSILGLPARRLSYPTP